ncbi:MAG: hypothetical protein HY801_05645 [Candidatus Lindowbacteria bacterium]|nr:hypothetical protein [Candidatus Lindowbacteria bacterium]
MNTATKSIMMLDVVVVGLIVNAILCSFWDYEYHISKACFILLAFLIPISLFQWWKNLKSFKDIAASERLFVVISVTGLLIVWGDIFIGTAMLLKDILIPWEKVNFVM